MNRLRLRTSLNRLALAGAVLLLPVTLFAQVTPPTITSYAPLTIPQKNPSINTQPTPYRLVFVGTGFLNTTTANFTWTGGSGAGTVHYVSATSVVVTLPTTIPATVTSVTPSLCNGASCATGTAISLTALNTSTGTLSGTPNPAGIQPVVLSSTFTPVQIVGLPAVMGAPSGTVTFTSGSTTLGTSKLVLDSTNSSFIQSNTATLSLGPSSPLLTADFNGDGIPDVLFYDDNNNLHVLLGTTPYGSFQSEIVRPAPDSCAYMDHIATGDLNNDGFSDIVLSCMDPNGNDLIYSLLSNGDGTFAAPVSVGTVYTTLFALADMNKDGKLDLVVQGSLTPNSCFSSSNCVYGFAIFNGNGDGTFTASIQVPTTVENYSSILLPDIDHDGYPDIVALNNFGDNPTNTIDIYLSHAGTSYGVAASPVYNPSDSLALQGYPNEYSNLITADFNGDGLPDLGIAFADYSTAAAYGINTMLNTSTPGNASFAAPTTVATSGQTEALVAADLNGDGFPDLVVNSGGNGQFFENNGSGVFANTYTNLSIPANSVSAIASVDLNDDGDADLLVVPPGSPSSVGATLLSYITSGTADANLTFTPPQAGSNLITATWPGNVDFTGASPTFTLTVNGASSSTSISSSLATTQYGESETLTSVVTPLQAGTPTGTITFLDGTTTLAVVNLVNATASYSSSTLKVGKHTLSAVYSGDTVFSGSTSGNTIVSVNQAQPVISWTPSSASITYGTALGAGQLDATAASTYVTTVPGTFNYTPASGTVLETGPQTLNVSFTPTDTLDFATATGTASITVLPAAPTATFTGPSTTQPGDQPNLDFSLTSNYPIPITGTLTLTFAGTGGADDPAIQFSGGGRTLTFTIPANSTATPTIALQSGTDAGTITVTLVLTAGGQVITPASIVPLNITIPAAAPVLTSMTLARSGDTITVSIIGYSDTRELVQATFHFAGAAGDTINTPDIIVPATALFGTWYSGDTSQQYGSTFLYTQEFNLSGGSQSTIGSVTVTLTNSIGTSTSLTAP
jgi:hypothetical protein